VTLERAFAASCFSPSRELFFSVPLGFLRQNGEASPSPVAGFDGWFCSAMVETSVGFVDTESNFFREALHMEIRVSAGPINFRPIHHRLDAL